MDDPAYKRLFARPRMVRDLLSGFAARDWSADLDMASLTPLPASYVSHDLRQRHGDLVWRVRFKDDRWLYVVLLLEFQSAVDRSMAVRMLTYTALLYQKLIAEGVLRARSVLPPVLPVVIYNGRRPWTVPVEVAELIASGRGGSLARYQPSQRYFLLDEGRVGRADLPSGNLVSALIALETNRDQVRAPDLLGTLIDLLRKQDDAELTAAFTEWAAQVLLPRRFRGSVSGPLPRLEEVRTMLAETVQEWTAEWVEQGREQGVRQGQRVLLCRQAVRKFDAATGERLAAVLEGVANSDRMAQVGDWIIECGTPDDLFARFEDWSSCTPPATLAREDERRTPVTTADDYGSAAGDLEELRELIAKRCPAVSFGGFTRSGARIGEYSFRPVAGRSAWVQAPVTPTGRPRTGGRWRFRLTRRPGHPLDSWEHAKTVHEVVDWINAQIADYK